MTDSVIGRLVQTLSSVADIHTFVLAGDVGKKGASKRGANDANLSEGPRP
ncbi:MAG: hypothetical protein GVY22_13475 [Gammaproteobacteria bacterium]|jgi:hypothetical protein|nr:hypothetical protein [Gammaproteobacteria bacterium]